MRAGGTFRLVLCNNASSNVLNALQLGEISSLRFIPQQTAIEAARVQGVKVKRSDILCWRAEFAAGVGEFVLIGQLRDIVVVVVERLNAASELWGHVDVPQTLTMTAGELYTHTDTHTPSQLQDELSWVAFSTVWPFDAQCFCMGTAIKHPVPDRVKPSFVIFDIQALWRLRQSVRVPGCQKLQMTA